MEVARGHAGDKSYDSPYAREMAKSDTDKGGAPKAVGLFGGFQQMMGGASARTGGKMDDITVIVSGVVSTAAARGALKDAQAFAALNTKALTKARGLASVEETKVARTVALRKEMDAAFNEKVAQAKAKEKPSRTPTPSSRARRSTPWTRRRSVNFYKREDSLVWQIGASEGSSRASESALDGF